MPQLNAAHAAALSIGQGGDFNCRPAAAGSSVHIKGAPESSLFFFLPFEKKKKQIAKGSSSRQKDTRERGADLARNGGTLAALTAVHTNGTGGQSSFGNKQKTQLICAAGRSRRKQKPPRKASDILLIIRRKHLRRRFPERRRSCLSNSRMWQKPNASSATAELDCE